MKTRTTYNLSNSDKDRLRKYINFSGPTMKHMDTCCWEWIGKIHGKGYGSFSYKEVGRRFYVSVHRVVYFLEHGPIPQNIHILHHCDNRICVRDSHLFLGTNGDNVRDSVTKGRKNTPTRAHHLLEEEITDIRERYRIGESQRSIAKLYERAESTIGYVINRRS